MGSSANSGGPPRFASPMFSPLANLALLKQGHPRLSLIRTQKNEDEKKRWMKQVNDAMAYITGFIMQISDHSRLRQLDRIRDRSFPRELEGKNVVYARVHLNRNQIYIGETENWSDRTKAHYMGCLRHGAGSVRPCSRCRDHYRYEKMTRISPGFVPLYNQASENGGKVCFQVVSDGTVEQWKTDGHHQPSGELKALKNPSYWPRQYGA